MRLHIIRHAEPAYPEDALTLEGHRQARALAHRLAEEQIDHLYCSPLRRALDTARPTAELLQLDLEVEPWTREIEDWWIAAGVEGEWPCWQVDGGTIRELPGLQQENWHALPPFHRPGLGSSFADLRAHSDAFLARHGHFRQGGRYRTTGEDHRLAVVCHAGFGLTWLAHLLEIPAPLVWAGFALAPASVTTIELEPLPGGGAAPRCLQVGDLSHLRGLSAAQGL